MSVSVKDITILTVLFTIFFGFMLGTRPFSKPDEGRYVEIPREMAVTGDFVTPRLNGVKYFEKPALFYWMQAFMIKAFGTGEWAMRFLPAFFGLLGILITYWAGLQLWGRTEGLLSAITLGTSTLYYAHTRIIILDLAVSIFLTWTLLSLLLASRAPPGKGRTVYTALFFVGCAGATLTKGLIGLAIPGTIMLIYVCLMRQWEMLKIAFTPWGIALFFVLAAPWHIMASLENPNFFYFYFIHEHFIRFLMDAHGRSQPFFFFIPVVLLGLFPWVAFLYQSIRRIFKEKDDHFRDEVFLLIWTGFVLVFFSLSKSKLIPYIMPLFPALALLMGRYLAKVWQGQVDLKAFTYGTRFYTVFSLILVLAVWIGLWTQDMLDYEPVRPYALFMSVFLVLCTGLMFALRHAPRKQITTMVCSFVIFAWTLNGAWPLFDRPSLKPMAHLILKHKQPGDEVICYHRYYQDLPPYLNQTVKVVEWDGELKHGMKWEDTSSWMLKEHQFWPIWNSETRVFSVMRDHAYEGLKKRGLKNLYFLMKFGRDYLVTNKKLG